VEALQTGGETLREDAETTAPRAPGERGWGPRKLKSMSAMKWLLGVFFVVAGMAHFVRPGIYVKIVPPYLPWPRALVYLSGACEVALGVLVLLPRFTVPAAWGLVALLVAVFPANVYMAAHAALFPKISPVLLWLRLPFQGVLIAWAYWYTRGLG
jgi:uncharacterized membrane protein